jgi:hypothetical protein
MTRTRPLASPYAILYNIARDFHVTATTSTALLLLLLLLLLLPGPFPIAASIAASAVGRVEHLHVQRSDDGITSRNEADMGGVADRGRHDIMGSCVDASAWCKRRTKRPRDDLEAGTYRFEGVGPVEFRASDPARWAAAIVCQNWQCFGCWRGDVMLLRRCVYHKTVAVERTRRGGTYLFPSAGPED